MSEQESLELITRMINATKNDMNQGRWNPFITWGVFTTLLGSVICTLVWTTHNVAWQWMWFLTLGYWLVGFFYRKSHPKEKAVVTYNSKAIGTVWKVLGFLFLLTPVTFSVVSIFTQAWYIMTMLMPLSLIYIGIGVSFTGIMLKEKWVTYLPIACMAIPFYLIFSILTNQFYLAHLLLFSLSFLVIMVLPGMILNKQSHNR